MTPFFISEQRGVQPHDLDNVHHYAERSYCLAHFSNPRGSYVMEVVTGQKSNEMKFTPR